MPDDQVALLFAKARHIANPIRSDPASAERRAADEAIRAESVRLDAMLDLDESDVSDESDESDVGAMVDEFDRLRHKADPCE
jgi:hypothetical protein